MTKCGSPMGETIDGCQNPADTEGHLCPYSQDVDNEMVECECCADCTEACAMEI